MNQMRGANRPTQIPQRFIIRKEQLKGKSKIGYGFGVTVKKATWTKSNGQKEEVVLKKFNLSTDSTRNHEAFRKEAKMLSKLEHRNIVQFYGICEEDMLAIVMEKAEISINLRGTMRICHSLRELLGEYKEDHFPFAIKTLALHQVCKGLQYLHNQNIVHNDLKSANVLVINKVGDELIFKICDFGESRKEILNIIRSTTSASDADNREAKKTAPFTSPEKFESSQLNARTSADIYALGVLMYEVLRHDLDYPWQEELKVAVYNDIKSKVLAGERPGFKKHDAHPDLHLIKNLENIIEYCWQQNPDDRPNIEQVLDLVSYLRVEENKPTFLNRMKEGDLKSIYEKLFDDPTLAYQFAKEVSKWNRDTVTNIASYFDRLIDTLHSQEKKLDIINVTADSVGIASSITGIVGFGLLFTPFTFIPGVALCAAAGALGAGGGLANGGAIIHKKRKDEEAKRNAKEEFKRAGIDMVAFSELVNKVYEVAKVISSDFPCLDHEYIFGAIHGFLLRVWGLLREIATNDLVIEGMQGLLNGLKINIDIRSVADSIKLAYNLLTSVNAEAITGVSAALTIKSIYQVFDVTTDATSGAVAAVNTFGALAKSAQVLQSVGLVFSILGLGAGIYGVVKNSQKISKGSKNEVAEMLNLYKIAMNQFWRIKVIVEPSLDP